MLPPIGGKQLGADLVADARRVESKLLPGELKAYDYDNFASCVGHTSRAPIPCKWAGVNEGDESNRQIRSWLVLAEAKHHTPPSLRKMPLIHSRLRFPMKRGAFWCPCTMAPMARGRRKCVDYFRHRARANLHGAMRRKSRIALPKEDPKANEP